MDLMKPNVTKELLETVNKSYPKSCFGCEHLRVIPDSKTYVCVKGGAPCKVDALNPAMTNPSCKFNPMNDLFDHRLDPDVEKRAGKGDRNI
ncbi:hypothetical protein CUJ83_06875 [Methanocella sp. CWC-04]|uniref:Uncharacterized protein n=1 Tax=Methanooceanicella nereidis TaxID=2052831 RepID=A0AAP2W4T6_9EURY|nr:hypothetical protein [Methanocella sp. CWC-04]MCD1294720.1 hypothetical protein [Methanocella sp. CWC-04]